MAPVYLMSILAIAQLQPAASRIRPTRGEHNAELAETMEERRSEAEAGHVSFVSFPFPSGVTHRGLFMGAPIADAMYLARTAQDAALPHWVKCMFGCSESQSQAVPTTPLPTMPVGNASSNATAPTASPQAAPGSSGVFGPTVAPGAIPAVAAPGEAPAAAQGYAGTYAPYNPYDPYVAQTTTTTMQPIAEFLAENFQAFFFNWLGMLAVSIIFGACCYRRRIVGKGPADPLWTFQTGHFGCFEDIDTCVCAMCCPWLRWADTVSMGRMMTFWPAVILISLACLLDYIWFAALALLLLWYRQQLREQLGLPHGSLGTCCADFWFALCCPCCLIAQEARVMKQAHRVGHPAMVRLPGIGPDGFPGYGTPQGYPSQNQMRQPYTSQGYASPLYAQQGYTSQNYVAQQGPPQNYGPVQQGPPQNYGAQNYQTQNHYSSQSYTTAP